VAETTVNSLQSDAPPQDLRRDDLLAAASEALPSGALVVAPDGTITHVNRRLESLFGYSRDELVGQSVDILVPDAARPGHARLRAAFMSASVARPMGARPDLVARRSDGSVFPVEIDLNPIDTADGRFVLAAVIDISARAEAEAVNRQLLEDQLDFERLVAELSVQFINVPADRVDAAIARALARVGEVLCIERCTFYRIEDDGMLTSPISWERDGIPSVPAPVAAGERFPWALATLRAGEILRFSSLDDIPSDVDRQNYRAVGTRSAITVPLSVSGRLLGAVGFNMVTSERAWTPQDVHRLRVLSAAFGNVLARQESEKAVQRALTEVQRLSAQLRNENVYLRREAQDRLGTGVIVGQSEAVRRVLEQIQQVAATDSTVLLLGETGTGKELFATQIHAQSARRQRSMVRVNCSAIPSTLIESELFGREKGAFTGALARQIGRFELADHSTIFLDEIGELPPEVQVKLLRVLEERQIERLGSPKGVTVDVRIVAATHRNLEQRIAEGTFRDDLFYRLNVFPIQVPPLRERVEDIPLLVWRFVDEFSKAFGKRIDAIPRDNMTALQRYAWPGNIRELRNIVERAMILASSPRLTIALPAPSGASAKRSVKLADVEKEHIRSILESTGWRIRGAGGAADRLGLRPTTLETRMAKLGLKRPKQPSTG
jgi:PAS domain S-box-containing protein